MPDLSVNIDHVATVRQARRGTEPDPILAAREAELGGAKGITVHLREDRRHIQDEDVRRLRESVGVRFNFEMAATDEMVAIARALKPDSAMLVPEGRLEVTTEGGLDVIGNEVSLRETVKALKGDGLVVSAFIDAEAEQIDCAASVGFDVCEVHTGPYAHAVGAESNGSNDAGVEAELRKVRDAGAQIVRLGMRFNAGHALNYLNVVGIAKIEGLHELHIGHSIVSRSVMVGMRVAVHEMVEKIDSAVISR